MREIQGRERQGERENIASTKKFMEYYLVVVVLQSTDMLQSGYPFSGILSSCILSRIQNPDTTYYLQILSKLKVKDSLRDIERRRDSWR